MIYPLTYNSSYLSSILSLTAFEAAMANNPTNIFMSGTTRIGGFLVPDPKILLAAPPSDKPPTRPIGPPPGGGDKPPTRPIDSIKPPSGGGTGPGGHIKIVTPEEAARLYAEIQEEALLKYWRERAEAALRAQADLDYRNRLIREGRHPGPGVFPRSPTYRISQEEIDRLARLLRRVAETPATPAVPRAPSFEPFPKPPGPPASPAPINRRLPPPPTFEEFRKGRISLFTGAIGRIIGGIAPVIIAFKLIEIENIIGGARQAYEEGYITLPEFGPPSNRGQLLDGRVWNGLTEEQRRRLIQIYLERQYQIQYDEYLDAYRRYAREQGIPIETPITRGTIQNRERDLLSTRGFVDCYRQRETNIQQIISNIGNIGYDLPPYPSADFGDRLLSMIQEIRVRINNAQSVEELDQLLQVLAQLLMLSTLINEYEQLIRNAIHGDVSNNNLIIQLCRIINGVTPDIRSDPETGRPNIPITLLIRRGVIPPEIFNHPNVQRIIRDQPRLPPLQLPSPGFGFGGIRLPLPPQDLTKPKDMKPPLERNLPANPTRLPDPGAGGGGAGGGGGLPPP